MIKRILITDGKVPLDAKYAYDGWVRVNESDSVPGVIRIALNTYQIGDPLCVICADVRVEGVILNNVMNKPEKITINARVITEAEFNKQKSEIWKDWVITHNEPPCKPAKWWWPF